MSNIILLSLLISNISFISSAYLEAESNYVKPQLERNNKINKGVWIKNSLKDDLYGNSGSDFIFRANSLDVDNMLQNDFDTFGENLVQDSPMVSSYVERAKRSNNFKKKYQTKNDLIACNGDKECIQKKIEDRAQSAKSKLIAKLKPSSVFNEYPYEVAILLGNNKDNVKTVRKVANTEDSVNDIATFNKNNDLKVNFDTFVLRDKENKESNTSTPKRNTKSFESEVIKKIEIVEDFDRSNDNSSSNKIDRSIFDKEERIWHQSAPVIDTNSYKVVPKIPADKNKPINERGLVKVLSMLTKTFKKIMKQHTEIKDIHSKLRNISDEVVKNIADITEKFRDFENKYVSMQETSKKLKIFETKMDDREVYYKQKDQEMTQNLLEFENQQKKFLNQQRQFYNIQKLMLAQNEKINIKQNLIAKTQSEISHRQNNFARILKKAKQMYTDNKHINKIPTSTFKPNFENKITQNDEYKITHTTTTSPVTTDPIKINLFSIPALNKLVNQDTILLKEKDEHPVDDLVYKYYFNNTFIDSLMKSKILSSFATNSENAEITRNAKAKRDEEEYQTTILFPLSNANKEGKLTRERRWIRHGQSKTKLKRKNRGNNDSIGPDFNDAKPLRHKSKQHNTGKNAVHNFKNEPDPFLNMAKNFCNEIGQHINEQVFGWCIEKALRRLQFIDLKMPLPIPVPNDMKTYSTKLVLIREVETPATVSAQINVPTDPSFTAPSVTPIDSSTIQPSTTGSLSDTTSYFPDNDELELRGFDLTPDPEGNVYFDGSVHTSDMMGLNSDGFSDMMLEAESNSRVQIDPLTFDLQAMRRNSLRRLAEMKKLAYG